MSFAQCEIKSLITNQPLGELLLYSKASMTEALSIIHQDKLQADVISHQKVSEIPVAFIGICKKDMNDYSYRQTHLFIEKYSKVRPIIYATTLIIDDNLDPAIRSALETTNTPIGKVLDDKEWEVYRKILDVRVMPVDVNEKYSVVLQDTEDKVVRKTYQMSSLRQPICFIAEHFSLRYLQNVNKAWS